MSKGVIFDFNGTMFFDADKHVVSWKEFALAKFGVHISDDDFDKHIHGHNNKEILTYLTKKDFTKEEVFKLAEEKEKFYQRLCEKDEANLHLVNGLVPLLKELKDRGIKMAIATASMKPNVDWYIKTFHLLNYFDVSHIIYDDGNLERGKPDPLIYEKAFLALDIKPEDALIFEDSLSGLKSALASKARYVVEISDARFPKSFKLPEIKYELSDFTSLPAEIKDFLGL